MREQISDLSCCFFFYGSNLNEKSNVNLRTYFTPADVTCFKFFFFFQSADMRSYLKHTSASVKWVWSVENNIFQFAKLGMGKHILGEASFVSLVTGPYHCKHLPLVFSIWHNPSPMHSPATAPSSSTSRSSRISLSLSLPCSFSTVSFSHSVSFFFFVHILFYLFIFIFPLSVLFCYLYFVHFFFTFCFLFSFILLSTM